MPLRRAAASMTYAPSDPLPSMTTAWTRPARSVPPTAL